jgi:magnesium transporter
MFRKRKPPPGSRPGAFDVDHQSPPPKIHVIHYTAETVEEYDIPDINALSALIREGSVTWVDVQGLGDEAVLQRLGELFSIHPLALADVVNVPQRPKAEPYDEHLFFVARTARLTGEDQLEAQQVSLFLGRNYVLMFQESYGAVMDPLRERIRQGKGPIRKFGSDYLAYAIIDAVIDGYYPVVETLGESLEDLEDEALDAGNRRTLQRTNRTRRVLVTLRRILWPQREAVNALIREQSPLISDAVRVYLRDCYDHCTQIFEVLESYREIASTLTSTYLSALSNRTNDIMKVLTIMASIFIPLTFMAGVYGMNFQYMPELHVRYGYPVLLVTMTAVAVGMLIYFYRRGWLSSDRDDDDGG